MSRTTNIVIPDELKSAPLEIKKHYINWWRLGEKLDNHEERYYDVPTKNGESVKLDCKGIWSANVKKIKRLGGYTKEVETEIKRRSKIMAALKTERGHEAARYNFYLNKNNQGKGVLDFKKEDLLEHFGQYKSIDQVLTLIKEWGFSTSKNKLTEFYHQNLDEIQDRRVRFQAQEKDYYLSTGSGRIESLSYLYNKLLELFDRTNHVKYASEIRAIIEQVRKEVKGEEIRLTVDGKIDVTATVQANRSIQELNQKIPINLFIVSLVAAKKGINPQSIMAQLGNSFYSNYNGFSELADDEDEIKLPSHLINSYNWQDIEKLHRDKEDRATISLMDKKLEKFFKENEVKYTGNAMESIRLLEAKLRGDAVPEIVDIEPLEVETVKKEEVSSKRQLLKDLLAQKKKKLED